MNNQTIFKSITTLLLIISFSAFINAQDQSCLTFDGNDEAQIPVDVSQSLGSGDFTIEAWINGLEDDVFHSTILSNRTGGINTGFHFFIHSYWGGSSHKMLALRYNGINWLYIDNGAFEAKVLDGKCHHVAVSKAGSKLAFFIDGKEIGSRVMNSVNISTNAPILIGSDAVSNSGFNGTISEVRMWNIGLTDTDIQENIEIGVNPNHPNLIGYWEMKDGQGQVISDLAGDHDAVLGSNSSVQSIDPLWGAECCTMKEEEPGNCLAFDGGDEVTIPTTVSQSLGITDFTFEAWISGLEEDVFHSTILSNRSGSINSGFHFAIHSYWGGSNHKMLMLRYNGVNWLHIDNGTFGGKILDGDCHHVAVSKTRGKLTFFIDGKEIGFNMLNSSVDISTNAPILIGSDALSNSGFNGTISDVRIWGLGLTEEGIQEAMENDVDPNDPNLLGFWEMKEGTGQTITDLTGQNNAVLGSQSTIESIDPKWESECCNSEPVSTHDLEDIYANETVSVFPNPSTGRFNVKIGGDLADKNYQYVVYDVLGRIVSKGVLNTSSFDLEDIQAGQYWLRLTNDREIVGSVKLIVIR